jgi:hypothetical protein
MTRKGTRQFASAGNDPTNPFGPSDDQGPETIIPGLNQPKSTEIDRIMDGVLTEQPGMGNDAYWDAYYDVVDGIKRQRSNTPKF